MKLNLYFIFYAKINSTWIEDKIHKLRSETGRKIRDDVILDKVYLFVCTIHLGYDFMYMNSQTGKIVQKQNYI
jgi:hypothetical protein